MGWTETLAVKVADRADFGFQRRSFGAKDNGKAPNSSPLESLPHRAQLSDSDGQSNCNHGLAVEIYIC
jgi:hypothetical protein